MPPSYMEELGEVLGRSVAGTGVEAMRKLSDLKLSTTPVSFVARVLSSRWHEVTRRTDGEKMVFLSGLFSDGTATIRFIWWDDPPPKGLAKGEVWKVLRAEVREWQGKLEIRLSRSTILERASTEDLPEVVLSPESETMALWRIPGNPGGFDVLVEGVVTGLKRSSGLIYRCQQCSRSLQGGSCRLHGQVEGSLDLRTLAILDDGTGTLVVNLNHLQTEELLGRNYDDATLAKARPNALFEELYERLVGRRVRLEGHLIGGNFPALLVEKRHPLRDDVAQTARSLLDSIWRKA